MATKTASKAPKTAAAVKKPAAPRAVAPAPAPKAAPAPTPAKAASKAPEGGAVIHIDKVKHGGAVRGAVNGQRYELPVGSDVPVSEAILNSLRDSHVEFSIVTPPAGEAADEGSSAASTVEHTAIRGEDPVAGAPTDEDGKLLDPPELRQIPDAELTNGADQRASEEQAETADKPTE